MPTIAHLRGVYGGRRAAALAGMPYSTLHYWAREGVVVPSISPERVRLWSWSDLLKLRAVKWLREDRQVGMSRVRDLLSEIDALGLAQEPMQRVVLVSSSGGLFLRLEDLVVSAGGGRQIAVEDHMDLIAPYGARGPDLYRPRPTLRIIPGKLTGQPHIHNTRIPSQSIYSLFESGYAARDILQFFPDVSREAVDDAIELETTLHPRAA